LLSFLFLAFSAGCMLLAFNRDWFMDKFMQ
jgi:hypothetical protein